MNTYVRRVLFQMFCTAVFGTLSACFLDQSPVGAAGDIRASTANIAGVWLGRSLDGGSEMPRIDLTLTQSASAVQGAGVMRERGQSDDIPFTVAGTYRRPTATLVFSGMRFGGRAVTGHFEATNTVNVLLDTLVLRSDGYERKVAVVFSRM